MKMGGYFMGVKCNFPLFLFLFFKKEICCLGWPATQHISFFSFLVFVFFKIKYMIRAFWEKNVKVVELLQFESLGGGLSVTFEILEVKVKMSR
jgi:hypothetical protein